MLGEIDKFKTSRRIICIAIAALMMFMTAPPMETNAITVPQVEKKINSLIKEYKGTRWNDYYYGKQCKGFANLMFKKIFNVKYIGKYNSSKYYIPNPSGAKEIGRLNFSKMTKSASKALLKKGKPGDFIQVRRRGKSWGHSMILKSVSNKGITVFDCNSDGKNTVKVYSITWSQFYKKNSAMSIYRAKNYNVSTKK